METSELEAAAAELSSARKVDAKLGLMFQLRVGSAETRLVTLLKKQLKNGTAAAESSMPSGEMSANVKALLENSEEQNEATADFEVTPDDTVEVFEDAHESLSEEVR